MFGLFVCRTAECGQGQAPVDYNNARVRACWLLQIQNRDVFLPTALRPGLHHCSKLRIVFSARTSLGAMPSVTVSLRASAG